MQSSPVLDLHGVLDGIVTSLPRLMGEDIELTSIPKQSGGFIWLNSKFGRERPSISTFPGSGMPRVGTDIVGSESELHGLETLLLVGMRPLFDIQLVSS